MAESKSKLRIGGEIIAIIALFIVSLWFFLINYVTVEDGVASYEMTTAAWVSGAILVLSVVWAIVNLVRFSKFK